MDTNQKRDVAANVELVGSATAGGVGAAFGGSKLRDAYAADYPKQFKHGVDALANHARKAGVSARRVGKLRRLAIKGKPGFVPLATATTGAIVAGGSQKYQGALDRQDRHAKGKPVVTDSTHGGILQKKRTDPPKPRKPKLKGPKANPSNPLATPGFLTSLKDVPPKKLPAHIATRVSGQHLQHADHSVEASLRHAASRFAAAKLPTPAAPKGKLVAAGVVGAAAAGAAAAGVHRARVADVQPTRFDHMQPRPRTH